MLKNIDSEALSDALDDNGAGDNAWNKNYEHKSLMLQLIKHQKWVLLQL